MTIVLFFCAFGLSASIAFIGTLVIFLAGIPEEGEEVVPWSELDAEGMSEEDVEAKIKKGFAKKKLYGLDRYKYIFAFPSVFVHQFVEIFFPCLFTALIMVYIVKYLG